MHFTNYEPIFSSKFKPESGKCIDYTVKPVHKRNQKNNVNSVYFTEIKAQLFTF